ncbi:GNAT family N-acetyltransferase [Bacillus atrophaeus]|uniref:GNAT family N-acetyltransferase n=1 Tax=Bacillus atrophaeus TaxID=1452 RepID=UPI0030F3798C
MSRVVKLETDDDLDEALRMSEYAFHYPLSDEEWKKKKKILDQHHIIGVKEQGKLAAKLHIIPFTVMLEQRELKMGGIAGVAAWPEKRRKGAVKELIIKSLSIMKEQKQTISFLHPFLISFYRKFGWELSFYQKVFTIKKEHLHQLEETPGTIQRLDRENGAVRAEEIYSEYRKQYNGLLKRSQEHWLTKISKNQFIAVYHSADEVPCGYLVYRMEKRIMHVEEMIFLNQEAQKGLWNFICQHDSMLDEAVITAEPHSELDFLIAEPRIKQELYPYSMARIVDVEGFLQQYPKQAIKEPFFFQVKDPWADWNERLFCLNSQGVSIVEEKAPENTLYCGISAFSAFFLGARSAQFLYETGQLSGPLSEIEKLDAAIRPRPPLLMDFF